MISSLKTQQSSISILAHDLQALRQSSLAAGAGIITSHYCSAGICLGTGKLPGSTGI